MARDRTSRVKPGVLLLIVGKSGSGKTSIANELERRFGLRQLQSYTTRPPRSANDKGHIFVTPERFHSLDLIAYTEFAGYEYGATYDQLRYNDIYIVDVKGVKDIEAAKKPKGLRVLTLYLNENALTRYKRMRGRGDSVKQAISRLWHDFWAFRGIKEIKPTYLKSPISVDETARYIYAMYLAELYRE